MTHKHKEMVNHPQHYGGDTTYEVIKVLEAWGLEDDALLWTVIKYIARQPKYSGRDKHGEKIDDLGEEMRAELRLEDLKKAEFYLHRRIRRLEGKSYKVRD